VWGEKSAKGKKGRLLAQRRNGSCHRVVTAAPLGIALAGMELVQRRARSSIRELGKKSRPGLMRHKRERDGRPT